MSEPLHLKIGNSFDAIPPANDTATAWLEANDVSPGAAYLANLAIEELVTNSIKYGYDDQAQHLIEVTLALENGNLVITVVDDGHAFDPLAATTPDMALPVVDRPIGGLGIHLLRKMSDTMTYERRENLNRVTLTKKL